MKKKKRLRRNLERGGACLCLCVFFVKCLGFVFLTNKQTNTRGAHVDERDFFNNYFRGVSLLA